MPRSHRLKIQRASESQKPRSMIADGVIVAGATAAAYFLTFAYEYGYCAYFGIPGFLIEPSTGTVLLAALSILVASVLILEASHVPRELLAKIPWPRLRIRIVLIILMWGTPVLMAMPLNWITVLNASLWTLILLADYILALIFESGSFSERMLQGEKGILTRSSAWDGPKNIFGATAVGVVMIVYVAILGAWVAGTVSARFQEGFIVLKSEPDIAVIKRYGDGLVAIRYDGASPRATGEFRVIKEGKDLQFISLEKLSIKTARGRPNSKISTKE